MKKKILKLINLIVVITTIFLYTLPVEVQAYTVDNTIVNTYTTTTSPNQQTYQYFSGNSSFVIKTITFWVRHTATTTGTFGIGISRYDALDIYNPAQQNVSTLTANFQPITYTINGTSGMTMWPGAAGAYIGIVNGNQNVDIEASSNSTESVLYFNPTGYSVNSTAYTIMNTVYRYGGIPNNFPGIAGLKNLKFSLTYTYLGNDYTATSGLSVVTGGATIVDAISTTVTTWTDRLGSSNYTMQGVRYGTTSGVYTYSQNITGSSDVIGGSSVKTWQLTGLTVGQQYYYQAMGFDGGWAYGLEESFVQNPTVSTVWALTFTQPNQASGQIAYLPAGNATAWGITWGTSPVGSTWHTSNITETGNSAAGLTFSENLTGLVIHTVYYWSAFIKVGTQYYFSQQLSFQLSQSPTVAANSAVSTPNAGGNPATFVGDVTSLGSGGNVTIRGFYIGTANGTWDISGDLAGWTLSEGGFSTGGINEGLSGLGIYSLVGGHFTDNTTYYYQAFVQNTDNLTPLWGYSDIASFTYHAGIYNYALVRTNAARAMPDPAVQNKINFDLSLVTAPANIVRYGTTYWYGTTNKTTAFDGNWTLLTFYGIGGVGATSQMYSEALPGGVTVNYQAFVVDVNGHTSYGGILQYVVGSAQSKVFVMTKGAQVAGNTAYLSATTVDSGFATITGLIFTWGTDSSATGAGRWIGSPVDIYNSPGIFSTTIAGLAFSTHYWYQGGVAVGTETVWGGITDFVTEATSSNITLGGPTVRTNPVDVAFITTSGFRASGTIVSVGWQNATAEGFQIGFNATTWDGGFMLLMPGTNFGTGDFAMDVSGLPENKAVWVRAWASSPSGAPGYGESVKVVTAKTGGGPGSTGPGPTGGLTGAINRFLAAYNMDTTLGHWGFIAGLMLIVLALFGYFAIMMRQNKTAVLIFAGLALLICVIILMGAIFSRFLGTMAIIITVFIFVASVLGGIVAIFSKKGAVA